MKHIIQLSILFLIIQFPILCFGQIDSIKNTDCHDDIDLGNKSINTRYVAPIFIKGDNYLLKTISRYLYWTNEIQGLDNSYVFFSFSIKLNKRGKIIKSKLPDDPLENNLRKDFKDLIKDIDFWKPAKLKKKPNKSRSYEIIIAIRIYNEKVEIELANGNLDTIYKYELDRPLKK